MKIKLTIVILFLLTSIYPAQIKNNPLKRLFTEEIGSTFGLDLEELSSLMIEIDYGSAVYKQKKFSSDFNRTGIFEVKLGFTSVEEYYKKPILEFHDKFLFVSFLSEDLKSNDDKNGKPLLETWRFGFANRNGYGYSAGAVSILPYHQDSFIWSLVSVEQINQISNSDKEILNRYADTFRFGSQAEGGVRIAFSKFISLNFGYEATVIYPRHLFWKWTGSTVIKNIGLSALSFFTDEIIESTPEAGPIVNFVLQNAFAYGFYSLQRNKMNWPFSSETPLTVESLKIGMSFTF
jgi:hypothetical protein